MKMLPSYNGYYHQQVQSLLANKVLHLLNANTINGQHPNCCNCFCFQNSIYGFISTCTFSRRSQNITSKKRRVRFDSYVLFLQGLRERNLELVQTHIRDVCDAALTTDEVVADLYLFRDLKTEELWLLERMEDRWRFLSLSFKICSCRIACL